MRPLWLELHHHHRAVAGELPLIDDDELSGQRRRALYLKRLTSADGFLVLARQGASAVVGYAFVCIEQGLDDTFPVADRFAEVYSLSVSAALRGRGIGTALLDFVDEELARRGIVDVRIAVMVGNRGARRLYERRGLMAGETMLYRFGAAR